MDSIVKRGETNSISGMRRDRERSKKALHKIINKELNSFNLSKDVLFYISQQ